MFDVFLVSECKLDLSFPDTQFQIANYNMFWKDQNKNDGGLLFDVNQDLNYKIVNTHNCSTDIEILPLELASTKRKWLILGLYKTPSLGSEIFVSEVTKALTFYKEKYNNILLMSDFNMTSENRHQKDFTDSNDFENLIKEPTCFKSTSPTTIDVFLTNRKGWFMKSSANKTEMSGHHKLIYSFLKSTYAKGKPKFVYYKDLKTLTKKFLRKMFLKISKTLVIHLKCFMTLSRTI